MCSCISGQNEFFALVRIYLLIRFDAYALMVRQVISLKFGECDILSCNLDPHPVSPTTGPLRYGSQLHV